MSINRKPRIAIDMDEVLANTVDKFIQLYKERHQHQLILTNGLEIGQALPPHLSGTVKPYLNERGFFSDLKVMPGSQEVVKNLMDKYDVYIASAAMEFKYSLEDKQNWLEEYFPFIPWTNIIFCGHKILDVDIMIDDRIKNFATFKGRKLLYTSPHNLLIEGFERVNNWLDVAGKLLSV